MTYHVQVGDGRVMVPRATHDLYLAGAVAAALVEREGQVFLVPLNGPTAGGMLLKQRNAAGDRVLLATEFLNQRGLGRFTPERACPVRWVAEAGGLLIEGLGDSAH